MMAFDSMFGGCVSQFRAVFNLFSDAIWNLFSDGIVCWFKFLELHK